jgi:small subunit ribosomal protein S21
VLQIGKLWQKENNMAVNVQVVARRNETTERMIKRFSKKVRKEGILDEFKNRMYYEKPSARRRREKIRRKKLLKSERQEREKK